MNIIYYSGCRKYEWQTASGAHVHSHWAASADAGGGKSQLCIRIFRYWIECQIRFTAGCIISKNHDHLITTDNPLQTLTAQQTTNSRWPFKSCFCTATVDNVCCWLYKTILILTTAIRDVSSRANVCSGTLDSVFLPSHFGHLLVWSFDNQGNKLWIYN